MKLQIISVELDILNGWQSIILGSPKAKHHNTRYIDNFSLEDYEIVKHIQKENGDYAQRRSSPKRLFDEDDEQNQISTFTPSGTEVQQ